MRRRRLCDAQAAAREAVARRQSTCTAVGSRGLDPMPRPIGLIRGRWPLRAAVRAAAVRLRVEVRCDGLTHGPPARAASRCACSVDTSSM